MKLQSPFCLDAGFRKGRPFGKRVRVRETPVALANESAAMNGGRVRKLSVRAALSGMKKDHIKRGQSLNNCLHRLGITDYPAFGNSQLRVWVLQVLSHKSANYPMKYGKIEDSGPLNTVMLT
ncbi:MAG: hypothetical protein V3R37_02185 [Rhodospirillales bacterium]